MAIFQKMYLIAKEIFFVIKRRCVNNKIVISLILTTVFFLLLTYQIIARESRLEIPDSKQIITLILGDLILFLVISILITRNILKISLSKKLINFKLQNRFILAFSLIATIPTVIISSFSAYFFHFSIQNWFDQKISTVLNQSIIVAQSYINEHVIRLKETAISVSDDLGDMYYDLIHNNHLFNKALCAEAEMRSLDEAIIFQKSTNTILAQTPLSFSLSFINIPTFLLEKADKGEVVEIKSSPTKIRVLIRLRGHNCSYLIVGRLIDSKIINHIDETKGAAKQYFSLKNHIFWLQIKFLIIFIFIALLLLLASISWGIIFASQIASPIRKLVLATERVKNGDLTVQVPEDGLNKDEIRVLSTAFNRMIKQINRQQRDLVVAQRALAWSDVARRVAHEIKNPLTPIKLAAERILKKFNIEVSDGEVFYKYAKTIIRHTEDIEKIVSEFVNFASLPSANLKICNLFTLIKDMVESRKLLHEKINYNFSFNNDHIELFCDPTQINQVMVNLLKNAEENLEKNNLQPRINISIIKLNEIVTITINDNGPGFSKEMLEKATEAYVTTKTKGTGLGLAIVQKIVQDHYGKLEISNMKNSGAIIKLIFNINEINTKVKISQSSFS